MVKKAVVTGMIGTYAVGGVVWDYGQYLLGLEELGYEVFYLEDAGVPTYDPEKKSYGEDPTFATDFLQRSLEELSPTLSDRWHFRSMDGHTFGLGRDHLLRVIEEADIFLNVSGSALLRDEYMVSSCKALIDTDPGYNHFVNYPKWDKNPGWQGTHGYRAHDHFFTYAEKIGQPDCQLPSLDIAWHPTRPIVCLDKWRMKEGGERWTTVMTWNNFRKPIEANGEVYGTKELEFSRIEAIPSLVGAQFEVAVGGSAPPVEHWRHLGWSVVDSHDVSRSAADYRDYIEQSFGEFSVAKNVYVATHSGWFSCRSVCYLAAGRPVIIQDTGFSDVIPTGEGLFAFSNMEEAIAAVSLVRADPLRHRRAARSLAENYFSPSVVLGDMLTRMRMA
jgi:hypothetical protein